MKKGLTGAMRPSRVFATFVLLLTASAAVASPTAFVFLEGYDASAGSSSGSSSGGGTPSGLETLNSQIRRAFRGENFYSRLFQWDEVDEAANYINLFEPETNIYMVGYSRGGDSVIDVANSLGGRRIDRAIQLDPVNCGFSALGCALNVSAPDVDTTFQFAWPPIDVDIDTDTMVLDSVGTQTMPANVASATSYYQKVTAVDLGTGKPGDHIQGEDSVANATNINAEIAFGDRITHLNIDDDLAIQGTIIDDMRTFLDDSRLMTGLGGPSGFGTLAMTGNDDGSTVRLTLPFEVNFGGGTQDSFFINNNGNVTFDGPLSQFTPEGFSALEQDVIAPFWGDVDTRCVTCGEVYAAAPTADTVVVTWNDVGYYDEHSDKTNTFQLILRDRYDLTGDVFDIEFRYGNIVWATGDASGGEDGGGGTPAFAGFTGGADHPPQQLIGSGSGSVTSLDERSNIGQPGKFWFHITNGAVPGVSADNPLLPDVIDGTWHFQYTTTRVEEVVWSDPEVAVGYDYVALDDTLFRSFILPSGIGDGLFDLYLGTLVDPLRMAANLISETEYFFSDFGFLGGVDFFRIAGIETGAGLDPLDTQAFVTGLTFMEPGTQRWTQRPIVADTDRASVPEPASLLLLLTGLAALGGVIGAQRRRMS